jgi:hypothetical protein
MFERERAGAAFRLQGLCPKALHCPIGEGSLNVAQCHGFMLAAEP